MSKTVGDDTPFGANSPFFRIIKEGLEGLVKASVVVLEYEVHGHSVRTGRPYDNRFVSVVTINDGKVTHWRDYLDPVAVFDAQGWPQGHR